MTTVTTALTVDVTRALTFTSGAELSAWLTEGSRFVLELDAGNYAYGSLEVTLEELDQVVAGLQQVRADASATLELDLEFEFQVRYSVDSTTVVLAVDEGYCSTELTLEELDRLVAYLLAVREANV